MCKKIKMVLTIIRLLVIAIMFLTLTVCCTSAQNLNDTLGITDSQYGNKVVVQHNVDTNNFAYNSSLEKLRQEVDRLLDEIDNLLEDIIKIIQNKVNLPSTSSQDSPQSSTSSTTSNNPSSDTPVQPFIYTVKPGDCLWKIAQRYLGNGSRYWEIVEANKARYPSIAKNPDLIYPGWQLVIPGITQTTSNNSPFPTPGRSVDTTDLANWKGGRLSPSEFCRILGPPARESMRRSGIPASIILAQAALETGWGRATIGDAKNLFGIKGVGPAGSITVTTKEYINGRYVTVQATFRKYHTWQESIDDHARLLTTAPRYRNCMAYKNNPDQFARELQKAGYATSPTYASKLISIMREYNLYQYDK